MGNLIRVHCRHCQQTYFTSDVGRQQCDLCRKVDGVASPEADRDAQIDAALSQRLHEQRRRCAICGSVMVLARFDQWLLWGMVPWGKTLFFRCCGCLKEIELQSGAVILTMLLFSIGAAAFAIWSSLRPEFGLQVGLASAAISLLAVILPVHEMITRKRYPRVETFSEIDRGGLSEGKRESG